MPLPGTPCQALRVPVTGSRSAKPFSRTRHEHVTFYRRTECVGFPCSHPQRRKCDFPKRDENRLVEPLSFQSHSPRADSASGGGKRQRSAGRALPRPSPLRGLSGATVRELQTAPHAVPRWKQDEAEVGKRASDPRTPRVGDQGQNDKSR